MRSQQDALCDILIIGGGLVGNSLALALADHAKVMVIEANAMDTVQIFDERLLALSYSSSRIFQALGLWSQLVPHTTPVKQVHVSDAGRFGVTRFVAQDYGIDALAYDIYAHALTQCLRTNVQQHAKINTLYSAKVTAMAPFPQGYRVSVQTPNDTIEMTTRLLVGADGMHSLTRKLLGIAATSPPHVQTALIARLQLTRSHKYIAFERFAPAAVLAALPCGEQQVTIIWTVENQRAQALQQLSDVEFCHIFQQEFGHRLGTFSQVEKRQSYPLRSVYAQEQIRPNAVLLGNAAHTLHPVAAQGFNLSLRDVAQLAQVIRDAMAAGKHPGELSILETYRTAREKQQAIMKGFTQGIIQLFSQQHFPFTLVRDLGLVGLNTLPAVKKIIAHRTLGMSEQLPAWVL